MKGKQLRLQDIEKDGEGEYRFKGEMYRFQGDFKGFMTGTWILMILAIVSVLIGGLLPATGAMDTWYVILPYAATIGATGFMTYRMIVWSSGKGRLRGYQYERSASKSETNLYAMVILAFGTLALEAAHLLLNGLGEYKMGAILLLISMAVTGILGLLLLRRFRGAIWEKEEINLGDKTPEEIL